MWSTGLRSKVGVSQFCFTRVRTRLFFYGLGISIFLGTCLCFCGTGGSKMIQAAAEAVLVALGTICQWPSTRHLLVRLLRSYGPTAPRHVKGLAARMICYWIWLGYYVHKVWDTRVISKFHLYTYARWIRTRACRRWWVHICTWI